MTPRSVFLLVAAMTGVLAAGVVLTLDPRIASVASVAVPSSAKAAWLETPPSEVLGEKATPAPAWSRDAFVPSRSPTSASSVQGGLATQANEPSTADGAGKDLRPRAVLMGHVRCASGVPVAGAVLRRLDASARSAVMPDGTRGVAVATTDAAGAFRIDQLDGETWRLLITSQDHPDQIETGATDHGGQVVAGLLFVLDDGAEIGGRVAPAPHAHADLWVRATPRSEGEPQPGVVRGQDAELAGVPRRARCAADGSFVVRGLRRDTTYRLAAAEGEAWFGPTCSPWVEARAGAADVVLACRPRAAIVFQVVDGRTAAPLTEFEVGAGYRSLLPVRDRGGRVQRVFPTGRVRIDNLTQSAQEPIEVVVTAPGYQEKRIPSLQPVDGQDLDLGVVRLWR